MGCNWRGCGLAFPLSGQKQQIKLTLKGPALKRLEKPVLPQEDDSGESDTGGAKLIRKRKAESPPPEAPPPKVTPRSPPPAPAPPPPSKKPQANRREELLKQLRAVEDAIARKRTKLPTYSQATTTPCCVVTPASLPQVGVTAGTVMPEKMLITTTTTTTTPHLSVHNKDWSAVRHSPTTTTSCRPPLLPPHQSGWLSRWQLAGPSPGGAQPGGPGMPLPRPTGRHTPVLIIVWRQASLLLSLQEIVARESDCSIIAVLPLACKRPSSPVAATAATLGAWVMCCACCSHESFQHSRDTQEGCNTVTSLSAPQAGPPDPCPSCRAALCFLQYPSPSRQCSVTRQTAWGLGCQW
ncbi:hypothetical protein E2C01_036784 [Portunus trituberculatus]|uniref:Uncharacterized protein n=1 Tax=Portunus trituberculatus TaxID=210409 RepID=A0A5B7FC60_PORTR|nr:hypothetical protein [Portunus trituberculatus]